MSGKVTRANISELIADDKNFNRGSVIGNALVQKSLRKFGAGRSILLDKNNRLIAGNKTVEQGTAAGFEDVLIVETTGKELIAVKRMDIDLDSPEGREMALADNASAKANIVLDAEVIEAELGEAITEDWNIVIPRVVRHLQFFSKCNSTRQNPSPTADRLPTNALSCLRMNSCLTLQFCLMAGRSKKQSWLTWWRCVISLLTDCMKTATFQFLRGRRKAKAHEQSSIIFLQRLKFF